MRRSSAPSRREASRRAPLFYSDDAVGDLLDDLFPSGMKLARKKCIFNIFSRSLVRCYLAGYHAYCLLKSKLELHGIWGDVYRKRLLFCGYTFPSTTVQRPLLGTRTSDQHKKPFSGAATIPSITPNRAYPHSSPATKIC